MVNRMALAMQLDEMAAGDEVDLLASQKILIDGVEIEPDHAVDLEALGRSFFEPGEHGIFTCGCGSPECAYIVEGVCVTHEPGTIRWRMRRPVSYRDFPGADFGNQIDTWRAQSQFVEYVFSRDQLVRDFDDGLAWLRNETTPDTNYSPYGFDRPDVDRIDLQKGSQCLWWRYPGKKLYVLCDQEDWFLLEGKFVALSELGLSREYIGHVEDFRVAHRRELRTDANSRLKVLEELQVLLLDAYSSGLPDELEICLVTRLWGADGNLDPWQLDSRRIQRDWLAPQSKLPFEYLIVTALDNFMYAWFDDTPEPKEGWPNRINNGTQFVGPFRVPLALEREFILWASRIPGSEEIPDWAWRFHWQEKPDTAESAKYPTWGEFHAQGEALARHLAQLLRGRVQVMYERPEEDKSVEVPRRQLVVPGNDENNTIAGSGSSCELVG